MDLWIAIGVVAAGVLGFALKDVASSVLAGLVILLERPFRVGDRVSVGGIDGEIREIGLRSVRLVTPDERVVTIPNGRLLTDVTSSNRGAQGVPVQLDFFIAVNQDAASAKRVVEDAIQNTRFAYIEKPWAVLVNQVLVSPYMTIRLRAKVHAIDAKYEQALESDVTERVLEGFARHVIAMPSVPLHENRAPVPSSAAPLRK